MFLRDGAVFFGDDLVEQLDRVTRMAPQRVVRAQLNYLLPVWGIQHQARHRFQATRLGPLRQGCSDLVVSDSAMKSYILAIDQGTTGSTALVMSTTGETLSRVNREFTQHYPQPGWVEHEPEEIWQSVVDAVTQAVVDAGIQGSEIAAVGITNQRETTLLWDPSTGAPYHRAIVWQDRRTADLCDELKTAGHEPSVCRATGLVLDPYFSGTKLRWLLDHVDGARARAEAGEAAFGTIDSYLVWRIGGGDGLVRQGAAPPEAPPHLTDVTNASRTLLMDLERRSWSPAMCQLLNIPAACLPQIRPSAGIFTRTYRFAGLPDGIPVAGIAGDQHAALFGQACFDPGDVKCTYGTGAFVLINTGAQLVRSQHGLLSTVAWQLDGKVQYALEGSCFIAGAAVQWLRDGLGLIDAAADVEALAASVPSSDGVCFVPALAGLGAPHWDPHARGLITGITRGTTRAHIARATLEAIALQVDDLIRAMGQDLGKPLERLRVDGGAAANNLLMQLQADLSGLAVDRPTDLETTARGAAMLAGIGARLFDRPDSAAEMIRIDRQFDVTLNDSQRAGERKRWEQAVHRTRS